MTATSAPAWRPAPSSIPDRPGCYLFRDGDGRVLYVGKAKSLRARVSSYFAAHDALHPRTGAMVRASRSVEWIVVGSEVEALHLEFTLIQRHRPRYNIRYRDDKSYPYLVLTTSEEVPRARVQRGSVPAGDRRFGPYAHAYAIRETLDLLLRVFPIRSCSPGVYQRAARTGKPCLLHHIERCDAPCTGAISVEAHRALVDELAGFLDGDNADVLERLEKEMLAASERTDFELAARRRDQLEAARTALEKQELVAAGDEDLDAIGLYEDELDASVQAFFVRRGRLVGRRAWSVDKVEPLDPDELLSSFLLELYSSSPDDIPPVVVVPTLPQDHDVLAELLSEQRREAASGKSGRVRFVVPKRGARRDVLAAVTDNARASFERSRLQRASDFDSRTRALEELQRALELDEAPLRIECFDISHLGGTDVVGSMVVFEDGLPRRSDYRRFKLSIDANDDYQAMREVIRRRFSRTSDTEAANTPAGDASDQQPVARFAYPPGLVVVDGGPGQLAAALDAVADLAVTPTAFAALAKQFEELWLPNRSRPVVLPRGSEALYLLQRIRDEAHRFAVNYQRTRRGATVRGSTLEAIPGVGPNRRQALLRRFGSVSAVRQASVEDLAEVQGVSRTLAERIHSHLAGGGESSR